MYEPYKKATMIPGSWHDKLAVEPSVYGGERVLLTILGPRDGWRGAVTVNAKDLTDALADMEFAKEGEP